MLLKVGCPGQEGTVVALHSIKYCKIFGIGCNDISNDFYRGGWYVLLSLYILVQVQKVYAHADAFSFCFGVTTMRTHHSVASIIGAIMFCCCNSYISVLSLSQYTEINGIEHSVLTQNGLASWVR